MSVLTLLIVGACAGGLLSLLFGTRPIGWVSLLIVPIGAFFYVGWWQAQHTEQLRSTSALDFLFVPLVPLAGAFVSYSVFFAVRAWLEERS